MDEYIPAKVLPIDDLKTLKVVADPLRSQIFECVLSEPLTVKQIAARLGLSANKLYYHVNLLERHGLIRVVEERVMSNIIERVYRVTATSLEVGPALCCFTTGEDREHMYEVFVSPLDATREDMLNSLEARARQLEEGARQRPRRALISREVSRIDGVRASEFLARLESLTQEFESADTDEGDVQTYALTIAFYPRFYYPGSDEGQA